MDSIIIYLGIGAIGGLIAGLLGVGGGVVIVPALVFAFAHEGLPPEFRMQMAVGTSLATIVVTATSSLRAHDRHGNVRWPLFWQLAPGIVSGAIVGSWVSHILPSATLQKLFAIFLLASSIQLMLNLKPPATRDLPGRLAVAIAGLIIGVFSGIFGIGGGVLIIPYLIWHNVKAHQAVGTSAACGLPIAISGAAGFIWNGRHVAGLPQWTTGYVYWPAFLGVAVMSALTAPVGAALANRLPAATLKRVFSFFLAFAAIRLLW